MTLVYISPPFGAAILWKICVFRDCNFNCANEIEKKTPDYNFGSDSLIESYTGIHTVCIQSLELVLSDLLKLQTFPLEKVSKNEA